MNDKNYWFYNIKTQTTSRFSVKQGIPLPSQEQNAVDAVMQYAINSLGFTPDNIAVFAWSIGGYTASWVAMNYPDLKYIVSTR